MNETLDFNLTGIALSRNAECMLGEICEHFVEHSDVERVGNFALLKSEIGEARIHAEGARLLIELVCQSEQSLHIARSMIAEHLFYFAGDDPLELTWSEPAPAVPLANIHHVTVVSTEDVTPHMRRVKFSCTDVTPFIGGDMHVRLLVPPKGRRPVWPTMRADGRVGWPEGEDELLVRVYTICAVDAERCELWIDFLQHPAPGVATPGADFARDAKPGDKLALVGPGGGDVPQAGTILLAGDETALPAIARIVAEVPPETKMRVIIEVIDEAEEQPLPASGSLDIRWLHRRKYPPGATGILTEVIKSAIVAIGDDAFIWVACEKDDARAVRSFLKSLGHDKKRMYVAWFWEKS